MTHTLERLFVALFIGHMVGDYILQNDWMARNKVRWDLVGWLSCTVHCIIYTVMVSCALAGFGFTVTPGVCALVFASHFPIDKASLAKYWMKVYGHSMDSTTNPFVPLVYVAVDNTIHIIIMMFMLGTLYGVE